MRIESPRFGVEEIDGFLAEMEDDDRRALVERLRRASERLAELAPRVERAAGQDSWSAHEVLAHIAVLSKFYGMLTYKVGRGELSEFDLLEAVRGRDAAGEQLAAMEPAQLLESALADHRRTLAYLESASGRDLRRRVRLAHGGQLSAADIARLPLCTHLEQHVRQLERALG